MEKANALVNLSARALSAARPWLGLVLLATFIYCIIAGWPNKSAYVRLMSYDNIGDVEHELTRRDCAVMFHPVYRLLFSVYANELTAKQVDKLVANIDEVCTTCMKALSELLEKYPNCDLMETGVYELLCKMMASELCNVAVAASCLQILQSEKDLRVMQELGDENMIDAVVAMMKRFPQSRPIQKDAMEWLEQLSEIEAKIMDLNNAATVNAVITAIRACKLQSAAVNTGCKFLVNVMDAPSAMNAMKKQKLGLLLKELQSSGKVEESEAMQKLASAFPAEEGEGEGRGRHRTKHRSHKGKTHHHHSSKKEEEEKEEEEEKKEEVKEEKEEEKEEEEKKEKKHHRSGHGHGHSHTHSHSHSHSHSHGHSHGHRHGSGKDGEKEKEKKKRHEHRSEKEGGEKSRSHSRRSGNHHHSSRSKSEKSAEKPKGKAAPAPEAISDSDFDM